MTTKIQKWGNSSAVRIPKDLLRELGWREGTTVSFAVEEGSLIISRYKKPSKSTASAGECQVTESAVVS